MGINTDASDTAFFNAYIECALWSSTDDTGEPLDGEYDIADFDTDTLAELKKEALQFFTDNIDAINNTPDAYGYGQAGHDFWLTRNGHGAGFWDRGLDIIGETLTSKAAAYGAKDLYIGDDGKIYAA